MSKIEQAKDAARAYRAASAGNWVEQARVLQQAGRILAERVELLEAQLDIANNAIRHYADKRNWYSSPDGTTSGFAVDAYSGRDLAAEASEQIELLATV